MSHGRVTELTSTNLYYVLPITMQAGVGIVLHLCFAYHNQCCATTPSFGIFDCLDRYKDGAIVQYDFDRNWPFDSNFDP
jgi:hypothetical protein